MTREEKQKAIDALKISAPIMAITQEEFNDYIHTINQVMDWLEQEPCRSENPNKWIPVSERLPDIHNYSENYFVTLKRGGVYIAMFTECDGKHWWTYDDDVIAWMPLPKPYEPQESEDKG